MENKTITGAIAVALSENLSQDERAELDTIITPRVAALFVKAFGAEMSALLSPFTEDDEDGDARDDRPGGKDDEATLRALMRDPRYWREKDAAVVSRVEKGFKALFPQAG
jgi:hypothetical protein